MDSLTSRAYHDLSGPRGGQVGAPRDWHQLITTTHRSQLAVTVCPLRETDTNPEIKLTATALALIITKLILHLFNIAFFFLFFFSELASDYYYLDQVSRSPQFCSSSFTRVKVSPLHS